MGDRPDRARRRVVMAGSTAGVSFALAMLAPYVLRGAPSSVAIAVAIVLVGVTVTAVVFAARNGRYLRPAPPPPRRTSLPDPDAGRGPAGWLPRASTVWSVELVRVRSRGESVAAGLAFGVNAFADPFGAFDVVVTDIATGTEAMRGHAGQDPNWLLEQVQRDLRKLTVERFRQKWDHPPDQWIGILIGPQR